MSNNNQRSAGPNIRLRVRTSPANLGESARGDTTEPPHQEPDTDQPQSSFVDRPPVTPGYDVGYGRPPKHTRFQKGSSGNKKGRPKGSKNASTIARELLGQKTTINFDGRRQKRSRLEIALLHQVKFATEKGDLKSLQFLTGLAYSDDNKPLRPLESTVGQSPPVAAEQLADEDLVILVHHHREEMLRKGVPESIVDSLLVQVGLVRGDGGGA